MKGIKNKIMSRFFENNLQISKEALKQISAREDPLSYSDSLIERLKEEDVTFVLPEHLPSGETGGKEPTVEILKNFTQSYKISEVGDMSAYFQARLQYFKKKLQPRLDNAISIKNARNSGKEKLSFIALVSGKRKTKNDNYILTLEDFTGKIDAIVTKESLIEEAETIVDDDLLAVTGNMSNGAFFVNEFTWPDIPIDGNDSKKGEDTVAAFLSDIHVGSNKFLEKKLQKMIDWINGDLKDHTELYPHLPEKLKYIFIAGDLVDGVGVYPSQFDELKITDIYKQYKKAAEILEQVPSDIKIIISSGNHDYVRLAQPQPPIPKEVAPDLYEMENVSMVSNPSIVKIGEKKKMKVLIYHGTSIDSMVMSDPNLKDGHKNPGKVMKALMKRRHLCPQYSADILPQPNNGDPLIIPEDLDIFHAGHVHSNDTLTYRGTTLINSGTWQGKTAFQEFLGHEPTPARLPLMNLKTKKVVLTQF